MNSSLYWFLCMNDNQWRCEQIQHHNQKNAFKWLLQWLLIKSYIRMHHKWPLSKYCDSMPKYRILFFRARSCKVHEFSSQIQIPLLNARGFLLAEVAKNSSNYFTIVYTVLCLADDFQFDIQRCIRLFYRAYTKHVGPRLPFSSKM